MAMCRNPLAARSNSIEGAPAEGSRKETDNPTEVDGTISYDSRLFVRFSSEQYDGHEDATFYRCTGPLIRRHWL